MKKGFTLVELLAVIVIIALLAVVAVPSAITISGNVKKDMYCTKVDMILENAKRWGDEHVSQLKTNCYISKTVKELVDEGILKKENETVGEYILNPYSGVGMDERKVYLYLNNKRAYAFYDYGTEEVEVLRTACDVVDVPNRPTREC